MNLLCEILGHNLRGTFGALYGRAVYMGRDGMGVVHMGVVVECQRCNEKITVAKLHSDAMPFEKTKKKEAHE